MVKASNESRVIPTTLQNLGKPEPGFWRIFSKLNYMFDVMLEQLKFTCMNIGPADLDSEVHPSQGPKAARIAR